MSAAHSISFLSELTSSELSSLLTCKALRGRVITPKTFPKDLEIYRRIRCERRLLTACTHAINATPYDEGHANRIHEKP